jgi:hypothetical protein
VAGPVPSRRTLNMACGYGVLRGGCALWQDLPTPVAFAKIDDGDEVAPRTQGATDRGFRGLT